jgi:hypothetical protein
VEPYYYSRPRAKSKQYRRAAPCGTNTNARASGFLARIRKAIEARHIINVLGPAKWAQLSGREAGAVTGRFCTKQKAA